MKVFVPMCDAMLSQKGEMAGQLVPFSLDYLHFSLGEETPAERQCADFKKMRMSVAQYQDASPHRVNKHYMAAESLQ